MVESTQSQEALKKVFDSFDKDKNGFIDISEIKALSKELGHEISDSDVQKVRKNRLFPESNNFSIDFLRN